MVFLKIKNRRQDSSRRENVDVNFYGAKIKRIQTEIAEEGLDFIYKKKKQRWIVGLLSFVCTLILGYGTHIIGLDSNLMSASIVPKIECEPGVLGCDARTTDEIIDHKVFKTLIPNWIEWIILFCAGAAILMIMIGGGMFLVGIGNDEMYTRAKTTIIWAVVGLLIAMFSYAIVKIIENIAYPGI